MEVPRRLLALLAPWLIVWSAASSGGQEVFLNEFHYDNAGTDVGEAVEVAGPSGTDLSRYQLVLYNGASGAPYATVSLSGTLPDETGNGAGALTFAAVGIQNGAPDGIALWDSVAGRVLEFLSYEGAFTAVSGVAAGSASTDIGVSESGTTAPGMSLQRTGTGSVGGDFAWSGPSPASFGRINAAQALRAEPVKAIRIGFGSGSIPERGVAGGGTHLRVEVDPPPDSPPLVVRLDSVPAGEIVLPEVIAVDGSGVATVDVVAVPDRVPDGNRRVRVSVSDPTGTYLAGESSVIVEDVDYPDVRRADLRVVTCNLENGPGPVGSAKFEALLRTLLRIDADVVAFQEATEDFGFRDLRALAGALGFGDSDDHLALVDDRLAGEPFVGGDFPSNQNLALASRHPIREVVQIGRDAADGRREMTRYPLFVAVDDPAASDADDPAFVVVHLKAGSDDADRFRKAVEGYRIAAFLAARGLRGDAKSVFILGDFNEDIDDSHPASFSTAIDPSTHFFPDGSFLPVSYRLGDDLGGIGARSIAYAGFPLTPFDPLGFAAPAAVQLDGSDRTRTDASPRRLDYILVPARVSSFGNAPLEVYNSGLERVGPGLPKATAALDAGDSAAASDHHPVFGDFELAAKPRLLVAFDRPFFSEGASGVAAVGRVTAPDGAPHDGPVDVRLGFGPWGQAVPSVASITLPAGESEATFEVFAAADGVPDPDRVVLASAAADGFSTGHGSIVSRNLEASGRVLVTRIFEPAAGVAPRAIELRNVSGRPIELRVDPLIVRVYLNGSSDFQVIARVNDGVLGDGAVLVVGDAEAAAILAGRGVFPAPGSGFAGFPDGWVFEDAGGAPAFVLTNPLYNGDDAIEVQVGHVLADVFGQIGQDPGSAWFGGGILTRDGGLERHSFAARGCAGFSDPSLRFRVIPPGPALSGFGDRWQFDDRFRRWLEERGLPAGEPFAVAAGDPDGDRAGHLLEFAWGTDPLQPGRGPAVAVSRGSDHFVVSTGAVPDRPELEWALEVADGFDGWRRLPAAFERVSVGDGRVRIDWRLPADFGPGGRDRALLRVRVTLL